MIIAAGFWVVAAVLVAVFVARAWGSRPGGDPARARDRVLRAGVDATVGLAAVRALVPPPDWGSWLWVLATVAVGVGVAGAIVRRSPSPARRRPRVGTLVYALAGLGLVILLA